MTGLSSSRIGSKLGTANNSSNYMGGSTDTISRNQRETLHSRFDFIKVLGKGTYGKVKLANDKRTGKQVHSYLIWDF
jgi:serine/threonine protein kinase